MFEISLYSFVLFVDLLLFASKSPIKSTEAINVSEDEAPVNEIPFQDDSEFPQ